MHRRWVLLALVALLALFVGGLGYRWRRPALRRVTNPTVVTGEATVGPSSSVVWKPVPAPSAAGWRASVLADDAAGRTQQCGAWDAAATTEVLWEQRQCVAQFACGGRLNTTAGESISITKGRWGMVASGFNIPPTLGPQPDIWVAIVRFEPPNGPTVVVILDDATGAPYLRIDST